MFVSMQMKLYFYGILFLFGFINFSKAPISVSKTKDFKIPFTDSSRSSCSAVCDNDISGILNVETAVNILSQVNIPVADDILAIVNYKCISQNAIPTTDKMKRSAFQTLCGNRTENCRNTDTGFDRQWKSLKTGEIPVLHVNFFLTNDTKKIKIKTNKCAKDEPLIFDFKINNTSINYREAYKNYFYSENIFTASDLKRLPIILTMKNFKSEEFAHISFNITEAIKVKCSNINEKYCAHLCKNNQIVVGTSCLLQLDIKEVEIENFVRVCPHKNPGSLQLIKTKKSDGMCEFFRVNNIRPCEYKCVSLPNCSYMCIQETGFGYTEIGYQKDVLLNDYGLVGSGKWSIYDFPDDLVYTDECKSSSRLCSNAGNCRDKPVGFECSKGDYNINECILKDDGRFWHCPMNKSDDDSKSGMDKNASVDTFLSSFYEIYKKPVDMKMKLTEMFEIISNMSHRSNDFKTFNSAIHKNISNFVVTRVENVFQTFSIRSLNRDKRVYRQSSDSFDAYGVWINETDDEHSIPLSENTNLNQSEFVKFQIRNDQKSSTGPGLITSFIRFKDFDIAGETEEIKSATMQDGIFEENTQNTSSNSLVKRFKNSEIISLAINQNRNVTIKYKLSTKVKRTSQSWLVLFEDECGFLSDEGNWEWSVDGCRKKYFSSDDYYCECDHLSNFAMLFSIKSVNKKHLVVFKYLSIIGGIINIISLALFLVFILFINTRDKLRLDQLNIAISLLLGTLVFLMGKYTSMNATLCTIAAISTQFFFLSAFIWKLILGINVIRMIAFMRYQNEDWMVKYRIAAIGVGYGVSLFIVVLSSSIFWRFYGKISSDVCWIHNSSPAFLTFLIPIGIILAVNLLILFFIANTLIRNYINTRKTKVNESNELLVFLQLVVTMGLTWLPSYFATIYLSAMYLWVIFFPLQGLMMFLFVVVINRENREKVSTFVIQRYSSLISKSTVSTDTRSQSKSKSSSLYKSTEQNQSLLSETDKERHTMTFPMVTVTNQNECHVPILPENC